MFFVKDQTWRMFSENSNFIFHVCSLKLTCVFQFLLSLVDQDEAMRVLFILMAFIVVLHR